jgi:hypothetical protein
VIDSPPETLRSGDPVRLAAAATPSPTSTQAGAPTPSTGGT